jgi:prevent-host-death family protein
MIHHDNLVKAINVHDAKTRLSAILVEVEKGETFTVCRNGKPIADLVPHKRRTRMKPHPVLDKFRLEYDPTEDLNAEEWGEIEG